MTQYEILFLWSLLLTITVELTAGIILRVSGLIKTTSNIARYITGILFASLMTLPYVWFIWPFFIRERFWYLTTVELFAWLVESLFYAFFFKTNLRTALALSLICNACSFLIGRII